jgi:hypothetical protein
LLLLLWLLLLVGQTRVMGDGILARCNTRRSRSALPTLAAVL